MGVLALAGCAEKPVEVEQPNVNQAEEPVESQRKANVAGSISGTSLLEEELAQFKNLLRQRMGLYCHPHNPLLAWHGH